MKTSYTRTVTLSPKSLSSRILSLSVFKTSLSEKFKKRYKYFSRSGILVPALILCMLSIATVNAQWIKVTSGSMNTLFANGSTILAGMNGSGGSLIVGANSGTNWYGPATPGMPSGIDVRAINANSNYVFVGSQSGLFRCANDGNYSNWTNVLAGGYWSLLVNGSEIFAGTLGAGLWHSTDNGDNWTQTVAGMQAYPDVYALASNGSHIFAGMYAGNGVANSPNAGVYRSDDNGATWTQKVNGLTNRDVFSLAVKGSYIFAGTNGGIFRSADNGENWTFLAGGSIHSIKVVCEADIYVALLNNGGVSRSSDNGATWTGYNTGNEWYTSAVTSLAFIGPDIFAGTLGQGIQKANIGNCPVILSSICGAKFNDLNGNANLDSGEPRLQGWVIQLSYSQANGPVVLKDTTDVNGDYCFNNLQPGITYTVSEVNQPGWTQTFPAAPFNTYTVTALAAQNYTMFFGNKADPIPATICGAKFNDLNGNANLDSGEPRLAGWVIELTYNKATGPVVLNDTTDIDGNYCFNNLQPGVTYIVSEVNQPGWTQTLPVAPNNTYNVTAAAGQNYIMLFGNKADTPRPASICGAKFNDLNGNANLDTGESRLAGWVIELTYNKATGPVVLKDTTDIDGNYCFNNLQPGVTYIVSEVNQPGWTQTLPVAPNNTYNVTAAAGQNYIMLFGNKADTPRPASICGKKFNDLNGDANWDSEEPSLSGWVIELSYNQANGLVVLKDTTDVNGSFCFTNLQPGITYTVSEVNQPGWIQTNPAAPNNTYYTITAVAGTYYNMFFGNKADTPKPASICGAKFNDLNGNANLDTGEPRLAGWVIELTYNKATGPVVLKDTTDIDGNYCFNNLQPGVTYIVSEVNQPGWTQTLPVAPNNTYNVTAAAGQNYIMLFGNKADTPRPASICGAKFNDLNGNGKMDSGEPGLPNWTITLTGPTNSTATTDKEGTYCFDNLKPGTYVVAELNQTDWTQTYPRSPGTYTVTINSGQNIIDQNFGNWIVPKYGSICGMKFNDLNGNGRKDEGEPGISDWQIILSGTADMIVRTDKDGNYCFDNLKAGEYKVGEEMRTGWVQVSPASGSYLVTLSAGQVNSDFNFGNMLKSETTCAEPPSGMVAWWPLDETSGTTSTDLAGFNNVGTQINNPTPISSKVLSGLQFNGSNNYIEVPDHPELNFKNGDFSYDAWIKTSNSNGVQIILDKRYAQNDFFGGYIGYSIFIQDGKLSLQLADGTLFNSYTSYVSTVFVANGQMNHIAITVSRLDHQGIIFYLNGIASPMGDPTLHSNSLSNTSPLRIGAESLADFSNIGMFNGVMDEIELFNRVITKEEINSIYKAGSSGKCKQSPLGSICGMKFNDLNGNGRKDKDEPGISEWQINLGGMADKSVRTDKDGNYCFDNLKAGEYKVGEEMRIGWVQVSPASGSYNVTLITGQSVSDFNFGNMLKSETTCVEPPSGMVAWWSLDETSGTTSTDLAGFNNVGTQTNNPTSVSAKVLGGLQFDGVDDYVEVPDQTDLNFFIGDFSFDAWVKTTQSSGAGDMVDKLNSAYKGYSFFLNDGHLSLQMADGWFTTYVSPVFVADGNWHHIAVTVLRTSTTGIIFYIDGVATQYGNPTLRSGSLDNKDPLRIGGQSYSTNYQFKGILDEIELFNRVITLNEVNAIFNAGSAGKCKPITSIHDINQTNVTFDLIQCFPNPFNSTTKVQYNVPKSDFVRIVVSDLFGREIYILINEEKDEGQYELTFDAKSLNSGVYLYSINIGGLTQSKKMILMK